MSSAVLFSSIWKYTVRHESLEDFKRIYAPDGDWVELFRRCPGYIRTELRQDLEHPHRFISIDYWRSKEDFNAMFDLVKQDYQALDKTCDRMTHSEIHIGYFLDKQ